jgi:hypothetical protein
MAYLRLSAQKEARRATQKSFKSFFYLLFLLFGITLRGNKNSHEYSKAAVSESLFTSSPAPDPQSFSSGFARLRVQML